MTDKKLYHCSFCGHHKDEVKKLIVSDEVAICSDCIDLCNQLIVDDKSVIEPEHKEVKSFDAYSIKDHLDNLVIGQDDAKIVLSVAISNHYKRINHPPKDLEINKGNVLLIGPTGSGKTLLARSVAKYLNVPFVVADATSLTEAGYVGEDVESMIGMLLNLADGDVKRAERGIVFIDEIDKIAVSDARGGGSVSREGVQRDLLPLIEGTTVATKYGPMKTDHILFIASGAFHVAKPSDLLPELQGRLPIRVELKALTEADFVNILSDTRASLTTQYSALLRTEGVTVDFTDDGIRAIARIADEVNETVENIGARRLSTVLEKLLEEVSFEAEDRTGTTVLIDGPFVEAQLAEVAKNVDLSKYVL
jgi:ATP-dependent protease HslVU (ClpYQ) ATPase subunit